MVLNSPVRGISIQMNLTIIMLLKTPYLNKRIASYKVLVMLLYTNPTPYKLKNQSSLGQTLPRQCLILYMHLYTTFLRIIFKARMFYSREYIYHNDRALLMVSYWIQDLQLEKESSMSLVC